MTTIVNNPPPSDNSGGSLGLIVGIVILLVLLYLGYVYGLPALRGVQSEGIQINVPENINVDVNQQ
ncbi:MAG: hypothetical protein UX12_C0026G0004 [Candidatus Collierbacteria bacterium GW2011_GWC1_45_47]|uniref:Uncharacterized protein n=3 Tax=Candidatus Collieribacteriota TaxID=1752725 RepID=A0A0G1HG50_9BACT|nr:MAG: hypothetical protein UW23_C0043G0010 [Candidatus Collierbacteria bacterium GW2011_GWA1_44_12]KKT38493.1 MAG: hypothetical protein UW26_C0016G0005 [Candidatus Collierbacteria bacterium GW2011_GWF1_44_12]KKT46286.1 MAG: hypothetical protein UW35_C0017G0014 [Candidatus Collierbacteria bacterium GW2011_GWF2_44_15]KKU08962.1 MAG: hypothetical protein UX12_C0026G0004 [Candidatus Collierbacteria bacterium GW2011_GWC1_45_47]